MPTVDGDRGITSTCHRCEIVPADGEREREREIKREIKRERGVKSTRGDCRRVLNSPEKCLVWLYLYRQW